MRANVVNKGAGGGGGGGRRKFLEVRIESRVRVTRASSIVSRYFRSPRANGHDFAYEIERNPATSGAKNNYRHYRSADFGRRVSRGSTDRCVQCDIKASRSQNSYRKL